MNNFFVRNRPLLGMYLCSLGWGTLTVLQKFIIIGVFKWQDGLLMRKRRSPTMAPASRLLYKLVSFGRCRRRASGLIGTAK